jgi:hypothetical protein
MSMAGTRRTPIKRPPRARITQRAVDLFKCAVDMEENLIPHGSPEYMNVALELHRELGLKPWDEFVVNVCVDDELPSDPIRKARCKQAVELRRQLEELCA